MNYKLKQPDFDKLPKETNPDRTLTNFQKKLTLMEAQNTKWVQTHAWND